MKFLKRAIALVLCLNMLLLVACGTADNTTKKPSNSNNSIKEDRDIVRPEDVNIDTTITVSPLNASTMNGGVFQGWGTSLCWWANRVGYSNDLAQQTADLFFDVNKGLGLNIMRYNIGGGDDPSHKHITRTDSAVPGWLVRNKKGEYVYDYDADANQLNVLKRAYKAAGDNALVEVFSNSPPYFMTVSGCSSGGRDSSVNNLKDSSFEEFAEYLAHVTNYIQNKLKIKVTSVAPMNEPNTNYWGYGSYKQEGCHFDAGETQSRIVEFTYNALKQYDLPNVIVSASDETATDNQMNEYKAFSDAARAAIGRVNTHTYSDFRAGDLGALAKEEGFNLWMSEVDGNGTVCEGEMGPALWLSGKIISDINALSPSAWVLWQVIDKHISKDGYNGNKDSGMIDITQGFWGTAVCDHDNKEIILTQKYYAFGQFTRFIRPGSTIIHSGGDSLAAYNKDTKELTVVAVNKTDKDRTTNVSLAMFDSIGDVVKVVRTSGTMENGEHWAELDDIYTYETGFVAELKAKSVTTFVLGNVEMGDVSVKKIDIKGATATGSKPWNNGSDTCDKVIDGSYTTFFDGVANGWVEIDLGKKVEFNTIGYSPRPGFEGRMVGGTFYGSNNGKDWDVLYTVTSSPATGINFAVMDKTKNYRYLRYDVPSGRAEGASEDYMCNIAEIELYKLK